MALTPPSRNSCEELLCLWAQCGHSFDDPELLYNHLANDHVGRKSTGNLCLSCHWDRCEVQTTKRDHITSHLRVHVPLKPHICESCKKAFKRPQDLKKHEKIHTPEHQNHMIKQRFNRGRNQPPTPPPQYPSGGSSPQEVPQSPPSDYPQFMPSQDPYSFHEFSDYAAVPIIRSQKRSVEVFDDFCQDVKRKRIDPLYNEVLVDKLEDLSKAFGDEGGIDQISLASFSTKEDLNVISDFLEQTLRAMNNNNFEINSYPDPTILSYPTDTFTTTTTNNPTDTVSLYPPLNLDDDLTNVPVVGSNGVGVENLYPITTTTGLTGGDYSTSFPSPPEETWIPNVYPIYPSTTATVSTTATTGATIVNDSPSAAFPTTQQTQQYPSQIQSPPGGDFIILPSSFTSNYLDPMAPPTPKLHESVAYQRSNKDNNNNKENSISEKKDVNNLTKCEDMDELIKKVSGLEINKKVSDLEIKDIKKVDKAPNPNNNKYNEALRQKHLALIFSVHKKIAQLAKQFETTSPLGRPDGDDNNKNDNKKNDYGKDVVRSDTLLNSSIKTKNLVVV